MHENKFYTQHIIENCSLSKGSTLINARPRSWRCKSPLVLKLPFFGSAWFDSAGHVICLQMDTFNTKQLGHIFFAGYLRFNMFEHALQCGVSSQIYPIKIPLFLAGLDGLKDIFPGVGLILRLTHGLWSQHGH